MYWTITVCSYKLLGNWANYWN